MNEQDKRFEAILDDLDKIKAEIQDIWESFGRRNEEFRQAIFDFRQEIENK